MEIMKTILYLGLAIGAMFFGKKMGYEDGCRDGYRRGYENAEKVILHPVKH